MFFRTFLGFLVALTLLISSCSRDPETRKKKFLANGNKYYESGKYREASIMYRNALKEDARFGEAYYRLALTALKLGQIGDAVPAFQRAVELQPDNLDAYRQLTDIWISAYAQNPKRYAAFLKDVEDLAGKMEKRAPNSFEAHRLRAMLNQVAGKNEDALASFLAADKVKPGQPEIQVALATTQFALNHPEETERILNKLLETSKTYLRGYDLAYVFYARTGKRDQSERIAKLRVANNPALVDARINLASHYAAINDNAHMQEVLDGILKDEKIFPDAYEKVGSFHARGKEFELALKTFQQGIAKAPDDAAKRILQKSMIEVYTAQNKIAEAQNLVDEMLKVNPKDPEAISIRAHLWLMGGKPER